MPKKKPKKSKDECPVCTGECDPETMKQCENCPASHCKNCEEDN